MSRCGLLLVSDGEGRRAALALTAAARIEQAGAVHPGDGRALEVAWVAGRIVAACSLSAALGWRSVAETTALDFGHICLLSPPPLGVVLEARVETARGKLWWRSPEGEIVPVFDPVALLGLSPAPPPAVAAPTALEIVRGGNADIMPTEQVRQIRRTTAEAAADDDPAYLVECASGEMIAADRVRLIFSPSSPPTVSEGVP